MIYTGEDNNKIYFQCEQCGKIHGIFKFMTVEDTPQYFRLKGKIVNCKCGNKITADENEKILKTQPEIKKVVCPKCGYDDFEIAKRGFTITTGFIGSGKQQRVCKNCLYKW